MEYEDYKRLRVIFSEFAKKRFYPKVVLVLNHNRKIKGYLINVKSNHIYLLKTNGKIFSTKYTSVKDVRLVGEDTIKIYNYIIKKLEGNNLLQ